MTTLDDIITVPNLSSIIVEVINPETPFGGVQVIGAVDVPIQVVFIPPGNP